MLKNVHKAKEDTSQKDVLHKPQVHRSILSMQLTIQSTSRSDYDEDGQQPVSSLEVEHQFVKM